MGVLPHPTLAEAEAVLRQRWGFTAFRPGQAEAVETVLEGRDVLAILPTGGGKSICYQVPTLLNDGLTLVVSPLIALMQDQVAQLLKRGIPATFINSTLSAREVDQRWTDAEFGRYRLLYLAPERLQTDLFAARAERLPVRLLAVDEAHCVSEWGYHFRPAYLALPEARAKLGDPPTLAVTATATPEVRRDIVEHLALRDPAVLVRGFDRPNIIWSIFRTVNKRDKVLDVLRGVEGSGLIYTATRRGAETWAEWLTGHQVAAAPYHGGLPPARRGQVQQDWLTGKIRIVAATNAFGMGIDKSDVRFVIHADAPASLEAYYQEAGRAGRDGRRAFAVLLYQPSDEETQRVLIETSHPDAGAIRRVYDAVCNLAQVSIGSLPDGPIAPDLDTVARLTGFTIPVVKTAIELLERQGTWQSLAARRHHGLIRFRQPAEMVRRYADEVENLSLAAFIREVLRTVHADAFSDWWEVDLRMLERRADLSRERLLRGLMYLEGRGILNWKPPGEAVRLQLAEPRSIRLPIDDLTVRRARRRAEARLGDLLRYAHSVTCRRHFLLSYFGEASPVRCETCDVCLGRHADIVITSADEPDMRHILQQVAAGVSRSEWFAATQSSRSLDGLVDWLIQEGYLAVTAPLGEHFTLTPKAMAFLEQWAPRAQAG